MQQRNYFLNIAKEFNINIDCLFFDFSDSLNLCKWRCKNRPNHETVQPDEAYRVVDDVFQKFSAPNESEKSLFHSFKIITNIQIANSVILEYLK